jgi:competence protein ComEA
MARLRDRVFVAAEEDEEPLPMKAGAGRSRKADALTELIDLNLATVEQLQKLPNIGQVRAQAIFDARRLRPFESVEDLRTRKVPGIGPKTLEGIKPYVIVKPRRET